jgi:flagellar L-ring protein FlgH
MRCPKLMLGLALPALLAGCGNTLQRLSDIGKPPEMSKSGDPTKEASYRPMTMPMPAPQTASPQAGSLWRTGSRAFFKDQRAAQVGDLITVLVNATDAADVKNATTASRTGADSMGVPNLLGLESALPHLLPGASASSLLSATSTNSNNGAGEIKRNDTVTLRLAGVVTQVLPNGNLVVAARQEMLVNSELRQLLVTGVVRPQDISSDNTITHDRMAEARIAYGGRGQLTDLQTARWGQQLVDILAPF